MDVYSLFDFTQQLLVSIAAISVLLFLWLQNRARSLAWVKRVIRPDWITHILFALVILMAFVWLGLRTNIRDQRFENDIAAWVAEETADNRITAERHVDDLASRVSAIEERVVANDLARRVSAIEERLANQGVGGAVGDDAGEDQQSETVGSVDGADTEQVQPTTRGREYTRGATNDHCAGSRSVRWRVDASEGWAIDVNSINIEPTVVSSRSTYIGIDDVSERGFTILGRLVNRGNCIRAFGQVVARDARGTLRVAATYLERRQPADDRNES